jgi:uncharacterized membrane protein YhaH (DUF805 family)
MNWYLKCLKQYADFKGRARRKEYWMFGLFNVIFYFVLLKIDSALGFSDVLGFNLFALLYDLAIFIPSLAVTVRRLHDTGRSGWYFLLWFLPVVGWVWMIFLMTTEGWIGENQYGADPQD